MKRALVGNRLTPAQLIIASLCRGGECGVCGLRSLKRGLKIQHSDLIETTEFTHTNP